jgi:glycosyltransferase involved in cell wall biosynthesis
VLAWFLNFKQPLVWTYSPASAKVLDYFKSSTLVYHCVDDISASPGMDAESINRMESELTSKVNVVFVTAPALVEKLKPFNDQVFFFNNVADYQHFSQAKNHQFLEPEDIRKIPHPRILFIGAISDYKVDFELIEFCALARPDWHWVMIGEVGEGQPGSNVGRLKDINNVHFLGSQAYEVLPSYLQYSDVAVIPARLNDYTKSMFPMKFFEYLSAGKQVVLTNLTSIADYRDLCFIAETQVAFLDHLSSVLDVNEERDPEQILSVCQQQTWQKRFDDMMNIVSVASTRNVT